MANDRLYWLGNTAKTKIISELLKKNEDILVFDYGCGDGGDWPRILKENPRLRLFGYEPNVQRFAAAQRRLQELPATLFTGEIGAFSIKADVIVSFSVLQSVLDRAAYLETAKRLLAADGVFYLNYDDGLFRNYIDLADIASWKTPLIAWAHNRLARPLAALGVTAQYQERLPRIEADRLVDQAGFTVQSEFYSNALCLKELFKLIPEVQKEEFARLWLGVEDRLQDFLVKGHPGFGDITNLWHVMGSRTLRLRHK